MLRAVAVHIRLAIAVGRLRWVSVSVRVVSVGVRMHDRCDTVAVDRCLAITVGHRGRFAIGQRSRVRCVGAAKRNAALRVVLAGRLDALDLAKQAIVRVHVGGATGVAWWAGKIIGLDSMWIIIREHYYKNKMIKMYLQDNVC